MIYHVYSSYVPQNKDTLRRMTLAKKTWDIQPWVDLPIVDRQVKCYTDYKGKVPYVKDILRAASEGKKVEDIFVFTNSDICVSSDCCFKITMALQSIDAAYCFRRDFNRIEKIIPDEVIPRGQHYVGSDLYAFRLGWWLKYGPEFPNLLLGREAWDSVLRILIEQTHPGQQVTLHNLIYHERHASVWENPHNRRTIPSQMHNVSLARDFCYQVGFDPRKIGL